LCRLCSRRSLRHCCDFNQGLRLSGTKI